MSPVGLVGALGALTGGTISLVVLALHDLSRAERARNPDEQVDPPMQPPVQVEEELWSASRTGPCSSSASSSPACSLVVPFHESLSRPVDSDGLRLRRRSHTRALRGLRSWLRVQGYRPPEQKQRPMITVSCRHARPMRS